MAGDEPSEDAESGADAEEATAADRGEGSTTGAPDEAANDATDGAPPPDDPVDDDHESDEGESDADLGVDAVEAEAEALVEEMEAAVADAADAEAAQGPDDSDTGADDDSDVEEATGEAAGPEPPDVEAPPLAPDQEIDPDVDLPDPEAELPDTPTAADAGFETPPGEDVGAPGAEATGPEAGESLDHAGPVEEVEAERVEAAEEDEAPGGLLGGPGSGPAEDREMPLADHIREMLQRLAVVIAVAGFVSLLAFPFAEDIINFLWYSILPGVESDIARPRLYGVLELVFTELKVASLAGLIVALPVMVYETYAFMRPGLYPHERRYYLAAIPTSLVLAIVGVAFAYFVVLPAIFVYFLYYSQDVATIGFALGRTFDLILLMMGYLAVVFQIPLFIMLAMMMGLVTRRWLAERRLLFWGAFLGLSFFFGFDPTGMAPIIVAATMIALFEGTLLLTKWTGRE